MARLHSMSLLPLLLLLGAGPSPDAGRPMAPEVKTLVDRMQGFYERTQDFTADFKQEYHYKSFNRTVISTGTVAFQKPAKMRWEYLTPSKRTFVLSGDRIYALDPDAQTLTKAALPTSQLSASVTFLWGKGKLADEFDISRTECKECLGTLLTLVPKKPDARFREVQLDIDPKTAQVRRSIVIDPDGSRNSITFSGLKNNVGLPKETFQLTPPPGTQILDTTTASGR
ncbi:MAG TPA: outer membrane lipoprotein carrier protein LolA [Myxococcaceae bacterium]|jgi:outer membrane lipoprotein carrier protein